jgi:hypothetical protein
MGQSDLVIRVYPIIIVCSSESLDIDHKLARVTRNHDNTAVQNRVHAHLWEGQSEGPVAPSMLQAHRSHQQRSLQDA